MTDLERLAEECCREGIDFCKSQLMINAGVGGDAVISASSGLSTSVMSDDDSSQVRVACLGNAADSALELQKQNHPTDSRLLAGSHHIN